MVGKRFEDEWTRQFDQYLQGVIRQSVKGKLLSILEYHMGWGDGGAGRNKGKRSRPMVCTLVYLLFGDRYQKVLPAAAAVELIHSFSLIYDDIQDKDRERRGKPAVWSLWGVDEAINAGSILHTLVFKVLTEAGQEADARLTLKTIGYLDQVMLRMVEGQQRDIQAAKQKRFMDENEYLQMIGGKTAALFEASAYVGALTAGTDQGTLELCRRFGLSLGLAFQIFDDLMGIWGEKARGLDKPASDLEHRKISYPLILAYRACRDAHDQEMLARYVTGEPLSAGEYGQVRNILEKLEAKEKTLALGFQFLLQSIQTLRGMKGDSDHIKAWIENWMLGITCKQLQTIDSPDRLRLIWPQVGELGKRSRKTRWQADLGYRP